MDDFRGNLFKHDKHEMDDLYIYTIHYIYIVKFVCFVLKNIVKFVLFVLKNIVKFVYFVLKNIVKFVYFVLKKQIEKSCLSC